MVVTISKKEENTEIEATKLLLAHNKAALLLV